MSVTSELRTSAPTMPTLPPIQLATDLDHSEVIRALEALSEDEKLVLSLVVQEGFNLAEIALVLDLLPSTAMALYLQASQRLETNLRQFAPALLLV